MRKWPAGNRTSFNDTLGSIETAKAALDLANEQLGARPVVAVIYTHSHTDHFAGAAGLIQLADVRAGKVQVIAPKGFLEAAVGENVIAGPAMQRRAMYQFGVLIPKGVDGLVSAGIGPARTGHLQAQRRAVRAAQARHADVPGIPGPGVGKAGMPGHECVARRMLVS